MNLLARLLHSLQKSGRLQFFIFLIAMMVITAFMMIFYRPICVATDPYFHHNRLLILMTALNDGTFPFYIDYNSVNGYGYFTKAFYCDLTLIPFAFVGNLSDINFAYDTYLFSTTMLASIAFYVVVKRVLKSYFIAFIGALLYTFSADRIYSLYYHTAMAEVITFIFLPVVFLGLYEIIQGSYKKWYILTLGLSAILLTHLLTAVLTFILICIFILVYFKRFTDEPKRCLYLFISGIVCLLLTAYYLYPMIEQMLSNSFYYITHPFINIKFARLPLGLIFLGLTNNLPNLGTDNIPKIGALLTFLICLRVFVRDKSSAIRIIDFGVVLGLFFVFTNVYFFPWTSFPFSKLGFIQFPWRLLKYSTCFFAFAGAFYLSKLLDTPKRKIIVVISLSLFILFTLRLDSNDYRKMVCFNEVKIDETLISSNAYIAGGEYLPSLMPSKEYAFERGGVIDVIDSTTIVENFVRDKNRFTFNVVVKDVDTIELPLTYYKGYVMSYADDKLSQSVFQSGNGLIEIPVNRSGEITVWYQGTLIQKISPFISILSVVLLCIYILFSNRKRKFRNEVSH